MKKQMTYRKYQGTMAKVSLSSYQNRHIQFVNNKVVKAIVDFNLIENGETILVAVSGGKDSLVLLQALSTARKYKFLSFNIVAIHIDIEEVPYKIEHNEMLQIAEALNVKFHMVPVKSGLTETTEKSPCFVCSWHRRMAIFDFAKKNKIKKVALGHHMDDAVETLLINMSYHANISSIPEKLSMFDGEIELIRPLILLRNKDTAEYANIMKFPKQTESCPYENKTKRNTAREIVTQLEKIHPKALENIFNSMNNIDHSYLPVRKK